jgi:hypothetical protein
MNEGDSFIYKTNYEKQIGFVCMDTNITISGVKYIRFVVVMPDSIKNANIESLIKGKVYTHKVYNGSTKNYDIGVACYDIIKKEKESLKNFQYIGKLNLNRTKFICGGGGIYTNELFLNLHFNYFEETNKNRVPIPLSDLL